MAKMNFDEAYEMRGFYDKLFGVVHKLVMERDWEAAIENKESVDEFILEHLIKKVFPGAGIIEIQEDWKPQDDADRMNVVYFALGCQIGKVLALLESQMTPESETSH